LSANRDAVEAEQIRVIEALLFAGRAPFSEDDLAAHLPEGTDVKACLAALAEDYAERGINLVQVSHGWALRTAPDLGAVLRREKKVQRRLSRAALETLAIIAYHQPATRAEIEEIRGVAVSKGTLDILFEQGWVQPRGRRRTPGRPATWVTTASFLDHFGLAALDDLPGVEELRAAGLLDARAVPAGLLLGTIVSGGEHVEDDEVEADEPVEALSEE